MIWQMIEDWFRGILTDGILSNLSGLFDSVNTEVGEIATQVGTTPAGWNAGIFNMIRSLSENVIVPIAGVINLMEGYGNDNPGAKSQGMKQLMAGGGVALIGMTLVPLLSGLFG